MRMGNRPADLAEQLQPLADGELVFIRVPGNGLARHVLHDEKGAAGDRVGAGVEYARDVGMIHRRERLPFGIESTNGFLAVRTWLNQLKCDNALKRRGLLGLIYGSHSSLANRL